MANISVKGRVVYADTEPPAGIQGLGVQVVDLDAVPNEQTLGWGITDATGSFNIDYPISQYGSFEWQPDIVVRFYDSYGRLLYETPEKPDVTESTRIIPTISLHKNNVEGWLVTNAPINPKGTPVNLTSGNAIDFFIDNEIGWSMITDAVTAAISSINFMILYFELPTVITKFTLKPVPPNSPPLGERLQEKMKDRAGAGVIVRVLANDFTPDIFGNLDTATEVTNFFHGTSVMTRLYPTIPLEPMHAKLLIIDGTTAFLIGSPIMQEYWDAQTHLIDDPRRGSMGVTNSIRVPIHEVNTKVRGPAVEHIDRTFTFVWDKVAPTAPATPPSTGQPTESSASIAAVQVVRTLPGNLFPSAVQGETGILEAYQRAIAHAEDFIYIENQYFTSPEIADAIVRRLRDNANVQAILLFNIKVDIPGYSKIQPRVIHALRDGVRRIAAQDRLGIFSLWSHEVTKPKTENGPKTSIMRNYIHSKTAIIDDNWATTGSANTDGTSMNQTQVAEIEARNMQKWYPTQHANPNMPLQPFRAIELNIAIYNNVAGQPPTPIINELRRRLWAEHLGYSSSDAPALMTRPSGGWLSLWNSHAQEKEDGLKLSPPEVRKPRILRWVMPDDPVKYLDALLNEGQNEKKDKIDITSKFNVLKKVRSFDFETGEWK